MTLDDGLRELVCAKIEKPRHPNCTFDARAYFRCPECDETRPVLAWYESEDRWLCLYCVGHREYGLWLRDHPDIPVEP